MIKDKLQIILITYNRKKLLNDTFNQIFNSESPIKNFDITILNNASDDGTAELVEKYQKDFPNIEHIKNIINIGGNANICRAIELAVQKNKEYFWIICDDDLYSFKGWQNVENAIENKKDLILVSHVQDSENINKYNIVNELAFLPTGIYKTSLITSTIIQNAYMNIYQSFPHLAIICSMINNNKLDNYEVISERIVIQNLERTFRDFTKGLDKNEIHHKQKNIDLLVSYVNVYKTINDKKYRHKCNEYLWLNKSFLYSCNAVWHTSYKYLPNLIDFYLGLSLWQKIQFILSPILVPVCEKVIHFAKCFYLIIKTDILK